MSRRTNALLALGLLLLAGCGSSKTAGTTSSTQASASHANVPGATEIGTPPAVKSVTYRFNLSGANGSPKGAPSASDLATLSINARTLELCWQFAQPKNVASPTRVRIYRSLAGGPGVGAGVTLASPYKSAGCVHEPAVFLGLLGKAPGNFFLSIDNAQFPRGAVRGRP